MRCIVSTKYFGEWLKNVVVFAKNETVLVDFINGHIIIKDTIGVDSFSMPVEAQTNGIECELNYKQLTKLERFLLAIPHQPIVISFENETIICDQFIAEF